MVDHTRNIEKRTTWVSAMIINGALLLLALIYSGPSLLNHTNTNQSHVVYGSMIFQILNVFSRPTQVTHIRYAPGTAARTIVN